MAVLVLHPLVHGPALLPLLERVAAMTGDWLDDELAREDHRHGMAYGDDAEHCDGCAVEARRRFQAECEHDGEQVEMLSFGDANRKLLCQRCGLVRDVER